MNRKQKLILMATLLISVGLLFGLSAWAQVDLGVDELGTTGLVKADPRIIIANIIRVILGFLGVVFLSLIMYGGFLWMTAGGTDEKRLKARKVLASAVVGLIIVISSYAIVSFVVSRLGEATGVVIGTGEDVGGGGGVPGGAPGSMANFYAKSYTPKGEVPIYNVLVRVLFNKNINKDTVEANFIVKQVASGKAVDGTIEVFGKKIIFTPEKVCEEDEEQHCFQKNTQYEVSLQPGMKSADGFKLICSANFLCKSQFTTGNLFDASAPKVSVVHPVHNQNVKENSILSLQAQATDDVSVAMVTFFVNDKEVGDVQPQVDLAPAFDAFYDLDLELAGLDLGKHKVKALAYDLDSNSSYSKEVSFLIKPEKCFDVNDEFICGDPECGACPGSACNNDADCASGPCVDGQCVAYPTIALISPEEGDRGNFITIFGTYFESFGEKSKVEFKNKADEWVKAGIICGEGSWNSKQVVVAVPDGAVTGPVKITNADGYWDTTDNERGWDGVFVYNPDIKWPGLCAVTGADGKSEAQQAAMVKAEGKGFGDTREENDHVYFGEFTTEISGAWKNTKISDIKVPNILPGVISVKVSKGENLSNPVTFKILASADLPTITGLAPDNGGKGQYVTVSGTNFGKNVGQVQLVKKDDDAIVYVAELGCEDAWSDNEIIIKIPKNIPNEFIPSQFLAQVVKGQALSNQVPFEVNKKPVTPGLCSIYPNNGPTGTKVKLAGENFGPAQGEKGEVIFYQDQKVASDMVWKAGEISNAQVPIAGKSGPVFLLNAEGVKSNEVSFNVGACVEGTCEEGEECCEGICVAKGECIAGLFNECEYAWSFSTGKMPVYPQILEIAECNENYPESPSPFKNQAEACPNAEVSAVFTTLMNITSFKFAGAKNVILSKCNDQYDDCDLSDCEEDGKQKQCHNISLGVEDLEFSVFNYPKDSENTVTQMSLSPDLDIYTKYRVTILSGQEGPRSIGDLEMQKDYFWEFTTGSEKCKLDHLLIKPSLGYIKQIGNSEIYETDCVAANCGVIECPAGTWHWEFKKPSYANSRAKFVGAFTEKVEIKALAETQTDKDIGIKSQFKSVDAGTLTEDAGLRIKFLDPKITSYYPTCNTACTNSLIFAEFNMSMKEEDVYKPGTATLYECYASACNSFVKQYEKIKIAYTENKDSQGRISMHVAGSNILLKANTYYRVVIGGHLKSYSNLLITNLNYDLNGDKKPDSFSWTFKTKNDPSPCALQKAGVFPPQNVSSTSGEYFLYTALAQGAPEGCDGQGEIIDSIGYDWDWWLKDPKNAKVGTITSDDFNNELPEYCSDNCLLMGSLSKDDISICGNAIEEFGEACDDGNADDGDGCSSDCLKEGTTPCLSEDGDNCCGNAKVDPKEDCDDGNFVSGDGCSETCLFEGSAAAGYVCGNAIEEFGEHCDDGNSLPGDGCNSLCLWEGSTFKIGDAPAICGNNKIEGGKNKIEDGEECDDGNAVSGDGCSKNCLLEGTESCTAGNQVNCCGNDLIDPDEECDGEQWCNIKCLRTGSSHAWGALCGNGKIENGEDPACEINMPANSLGHWQQIAKVLGIIKDEADLENGEFAFTALVNVEPEGVPEYVELASGELIYTLLKYNNGSADGEGEGPADDACEGYGDLQIIKTVPANGAIDVCTNVFLEIEFNQPIKTANLSEKIVLRKDEAAADKVGIKIQAVVQSEDKHTIVKIKPQKLLAENQEYIVQIDNGLINECGEELDFSQKFGFKTIGLCQVDSLELQPTIAYYTQHDATFYIDETGVSNSEFDLSVKSKQYEIYEVAGIYDWTVDWTSKDETIFEIFKGDDLTRSGQVFQKAGETILQVVLEITTDLTFDTADEKFETGAQIVVFFCENPWFLANEDAEVGFNLDLYYCRDLGEANLQTDDLPYLKVVVGPKNEDVTPKIRKEIFFLRDEGDIAYDYAPDAVSLRIMDNPGYITPEMWYQKNVPNPGSPQNVLVDGYQAVQDGRTIYISAGNVELGKKKIYNNMYVVSYTDNATGKTLNIVGQFINNLKFNKNLNFPEKKKLTRDIKRVNEIAYIKNLLNKYNGFYSSYPKIEAGSYVKHETSSVWPSWQAELANALGALLPNDPLNYFALESPFVPEGEVNTEKYSVCGAGYCEKAKSQCLADLYCRMCPQEYSINTCYDSKNQKFYNAVMGAENFNPVYYYKYIDDENYELNYQLETEKYLEYKFNYKP